MSAMPSTVFVTYYGDEIGMIDHDDITWDNTQDLQACSLNPIEFNDISRDKQRTIFQWDDRKYAGFCICNQNVQPWISVNPNNKDINLVQNMRDEKSVYKFYQNIVDKIKYFGVDWMNFNITILNSQVFAFIGTTGPDSFITLINFGNSSAQVDLQNIKYPIVPKPNLSVYSVSTKSSLKLK
jgi:alpha-glucosidase